MKSKVIFIALLLVIGISLKAQVVDKETSLSEAMKNIRTEKDEFTHTTLYFSDRTPKNQNDFMDRFFIYISVPENNGQPRLFLEVSHSENFHPLVGYINIQSILLLSDDKTVELPMNLGNISGNGTQHSIFTMGFGRRPVYFDFVNGMVNAKNTKARIITFKNKLLDFDISSRERKGIADVLALWDLLKK